MAISSTVLKTIKGYSSRLGKENDYLLTEFKKLLEIDTKKHPRAINHEERSLIALRKFIRDIDQNLIPSSAISFRGGIFGDSGVMDHVDMIRKGAEGMYARDKPRAIRERRTNRQGEPLDTREIILNKKERKMVPNPRYGYPLAEDDHSYFRSVYGVAGMGEQLKDIKFFKMKTSAELALNLKYPWSKEMEFRALTRESKDDTEYILGFSRVTEFSVFDEPDFSLFDLIQKCGKKIWNVDQIMEVYQMFGDNKPWEKPQLFSAEVREIRAEPDKLNNRTLWLDNEKLMMDKDSGVRFQFPFVIPIENSQKVIALGYVNKFKNRRGEDAYTIRGYGYYPIPGFNRD